MYLPQITTLTKYAMNMHWCIEFSSASYVSNTTSLALFIEMLRKELLAEFGTRNVFLRIDLPWLVETRLHRKQRCRPDFMSKLQPRLSTPWFYFP